MIPKKIISLQHPIVKHLVKLRISSHYRKKEKCVLVCGSKLVSELKVKRLFIAPDFSLHPSIKAEETLFLAPPLFKKITGLVHPEPIAAEISYPEESDLSQQSPLLALDDISDPGNLGTLLRTALALGWEGVFLTEACVNPFNDKALRAAKGATFHLPYKSGSRAELRELIEKRGLTAIAADVRGEDLSTLKTESPLILILGSEARGIDSLLKKFSTLVTIPMSGNMESLNVASAGAILMYALSQSR